MNTDNITRDLLVFSKKNKNNWFINEIIGFLRRTISRLDLSSRSIFTIVDNNSCFSGILAELLFCADRTYMLNNALEANGSKRPLT